MHAENFHDIKKKIKCKSQGILSVEESKKFSFRRKADKNVFLLPWLFNRN